MPIGIRYHLGYIEIRTLGIRARTSTHLYGTKAGAAGRRQGLRAKFARTKNQGPCNAVATPQPAVFSVDSPIKGLFFLNPHAPLLAWCTGDVSKSPTRCRARCPSSAVGLKSGQGQPNYSLSLKSYGGGAPRSRRIAVCCRSRCGGNVNRRREYHHPGRLELRLELEISPSTSRRTSCLPPR